MNKVLSIAKYVCLVLGYLIVVTLATLGWSHLEYDYAYLPHLDFFVWGMFILCILMGLLFACKTALKDFAVEAVSMLIVLFCFSLITCILWAILTYQVDFLPTIPLIAWYIFYILLCLIIKAFKIMIREK
jgi:hypothetical protein